jgi:hypothetical protein
LVPTFFHGLIHHRVEQLAVVSLRLPFDQLPSPPSRGFTLRKHQPAIVRRDRRKLMHNIEELFFVLAAQLPAVGYRARQKCASVLSVAEEEMVTGDFCSGAVVWALAETAPPTRARALTHRIFSVNG